MRWSLTTLLMLLPVVAHAGQGGNDLGPLLAKIKAVGKEGAGSVEAANAWQQLVLHGNDALLPILAAFDGAHPVAVNYLRSAFETIADRSLAKQKSLPAGQLEAFVKDPKHNGAARRLAFEYLTQVDKTARDRLLPAMIDDPGQELRREAVAVLLDKALKLFDSKDAAAAAALQKVLKHARDRDQLLLVGKRLDELGIEFDLTRHFGFVTQWKVAGPFDSTGGKGYHTVFAPEKNIDILAVYEGKGGKKVTWIDTVTTAEFAIVDFNKHFGDLKGVVAFAATQVQSDKERPVEIRVGSNNAVVFYLNGKKVFGREEYHHGMQMDQHIGRGTLVKGTNTILIKVCQNEQTDSWANLWSFQLRVCDELGGALPVTTGWVK